MRKCPECKNHLPPGSSKFDEEHNVICAKCSNVVIAAVITKERKVVTTTTIIPYNQRHTALGGYPHNHYDGFGD